MTLVAVGPIVHTAIRPNSALGPGNADTGQVPNPWFGVIGILNNAFYAPVVQVNSVVWESGMANVRAGITITAGTPDLIFRLQDANNCWGLLTSGGFLGLYLRQNGVITGPFVQAVYVPVAGDRFEVLTNGNVITAYVNGVQQLTYNSPIFNTATQHGFEINSAGTYCNLFTCVASVATIITPWCTDDLVARCIRHARRPATDRQVLLADWYAFLTEAQGDVYPDLFTRYPDLQYGAPALLTTADGGKTYTFGLDGVGDPITPMGHLELYPTLDAIPESPLVPGDDFLLEGSLIRIPGNRTRRFTAGPYARLIIRADDSVALSSGVNPQLEPKRLRMLLVWKALESWAGRPGSGADPTYYAARYQDALGKAWLELATAYNMAAANGNPARSRWWTMMDLSQRGALNT